jgi:tRNA dimethylallyltransferase
VQGEPPDERPLALCLMGPTASGKTALALELADARGAGLISVDSAQVYRGMDIGTAKPGPEILARYPHRLIDIRDPAEPYSAAGFRHDAIGAMREVLAEGRMPLLVGGTMLYFKVLAQGLSALPPADPAVRADIEALALREGWAAVHRRLVEVDPRAAARIHPSDPQRLQRALEVYLVSGRSLSDLQSEPVDVEPLPCRLLWLALAPADRAVLHQRIATRFDAMLAEGFLAEVEALYRRGDLSPSLPSIRSAGYRQAWEHLAGRMAYAEMRDRAIMATRQLAKRQLTWLRSWPGVTWILLDEAGRPLADDARTPLDLALKFLDSGTI